MAEINHAWQVLGDSGRRSEYDLSMASPTSREASQQEPTGWPTDPAPTAPRYNPLARYEDPPRFPWRFMGVLLLLGIGFVILGVVTAGDPVPPKVDNVLNPGDCVVIEPNGDASERLCTDPHDGVMRVLLTTDERCPEGSEPHRDRQGMGTACVTFG